MFPLFAIVFDHSGKIGHIHKFCIEQPTNLPIFPAKDMAKNLDPIFLGNFQVLAFKIEQSIPSQVAYGWIFFGISIPQAHLPGLWDFSIKHSESKIAKNPESPGLVVST